MPVQYRGWHENCVVQLGGKGFGIEENAEQRDLDYATTLNFQKL